MKLSFISTLFTLLVISGLLNAGLISGWVRIGSPEKMTETAYNDYSRHLMDQLVEKTDAE